MPGVFKNRSGEEIMKRRSVFSLLIGLTLCGLAIASTIVQSVSATAVHHVTIATPTVGNHVTCVVSLPNATADKTNFSGVFWYNPDGTGARGVKFTKTGHVFPANPGGNTGWQETWEADVTKAWYEFAPGQTHVKLGIARDPVLYYATVTEEAP